MRRAHSRGQDSLGGLDLVRLKWLHQARELATVDGPDDEYGIGVPVEEPFDGHERWSVLSR